MKDDKRDYETEERLAILYEQIGEMEDALSRIKRVVYNNGMTAEQKIMSLKTELGS